MKNIFLLALVLIVNCAEARNYYFSGKRGDDNRTSTQAQNSATPWKSLSKLNSFFPSLQPGDSVLFKRGETFYGFINAKKSGSASLPIVFSAYGTGAQPIISGLTTLTGWTNIGNNIWESAPLADAGAQVNIVLISGVNVPMGRYPNADEPNKGFFTYSSHSGNVSITDNKLAPSPNWKGAELILRKARWTFDRSLITDHSGSKLTYKAQTDYEPEDGFGYFIENDIRTLDEKGEWYYNPKTKRIDIYYGALPPPANIIQTASVDNLVFLRNYSYLTFENLSFRGSNMNAFELANQQNISINNCDIRFSGIDAFYGYGITNITIQNCTIANTNNNAIYLVANCANAVIKNNTIKSTGLYMGMGNAIYYNTVSGIITGGSGNNSCKNATIQGNIIDSTGYNAISFVGNNTLIKNNVVTNFCMTKDDGGGIYTYKGTDDNYNYTGCSVTGNIVLNGKSSAAGTADPSLTYTWGIYMDDNSEGVEISDNTVANMPNNAIFLHNAHDIKIQSNTLFNNPAQAFFSHDDNPPFNTIRNVTNSNNIYFAKTPQQLCLDFLSVANDIKSYGLGDNNCYISPFGDDFTFHTKTPADDFFGVKSILTDWQAISGSDLHAQVTPLKYAAYKSVLGTQIKNITFDAATSINSEGIITQNGTSTWSAGPLDKGTLKVTPSGTFTLINIPIGKTVSGKDYLVRFSSQSTNNGYIQVYLSQSEGNVDYGADNKNAIIQKTRKENEIVLHATYSGNNDFVVLKIYSADGPCYFDNVQIYNATIIDTNPDDYIRFEYNPTNTVKTITLNKPYIDARNVTYKNSISLKPYTSVVLMAVDGKYRINNKQSNSQPVVY